MKKKPSIKKSDEVGRLLFHMIQNPEKYQTKEMKI
jgi:hypothetical protein